MGVYVVTGGSGGIGGKTVEILREQGHEVINVDLKDSDISANLATKEGRDEVIQKIHELHPEGIDGLCCNAGVSGACGNVKLMVSLNYFGATNLAQHYYDAGYQVLAPDLRACGDSEGDYVGMGWLDRKDVLQWIDWVLAQDSEAEIVLHGVSMGAATTMMTAGEDTPEQVKVFVEDCGYTSVWDIFSSELKLRFGLPEFPILYTASATARAKAGYGFKEASALQQVQNCEKPMLFIHGTADDFIPYEMMGTLYNAKPGTNKATLTAEGAGHGEAMDVLGDTYWNTVFDFEGQYMAG